MKVSEAMTQDVRVASPEETVQKAARTGPVSIPGFSPSARRIT